MKVPSSLNRYEGIPTHLVAVDCIIFGVDVGGLKLLIFRREIEPLAGQWSLLGSFVKSGEDVLGAAARVLEELTGLRNIYMEQLHCFGATDRDDGGRVISVAHWALIRIDLAHRTFQVDDHEAVWVSIDEIPELILDHGGMVALAIRKLQERARFYPIGFELLPKEFTILQLQQVYEAIYQYELDERNFRKKILKSGLIVQLDKKDMSTSRKGSFLYRFDKQRYQTLAKAGHDFAF